jgi:hypothetical protein
MDFAFGKDRELDYEGMDLEEGWLEEKIGEARGSRLGRKSGKEKEHKLCDGGTLPRRRPQASCTLTGSEADETFC